MKISRRWRIGPNIQCDLWLAASCAGCLVFAMPAVAAAILDAPPLMASEVFGLTSNGCGIVMDTGRPGAVVEIPATVTTPARKVTAEQYIGEQVWKGDCSSGLAMGWGRYGPPGKDGVDSEFWPEQEFAYGYSLDVMRSQMDTHYMLPAVEGAARQVSIRRLGEDGSGAPAWASSGSDLWGGSSVSADGLNFRTNTSNCYIDSKRFRGCSGDGYPVFGITRQELVTGGQVTEHWCPDPRSSSGCASLWNELAGPTLAKARAIISEWREKRDARVEEYALTMRPWLSRKDERDAAQRAEADRLAAERDSAARAAEQRYRDSLKTLNAGELFTLADELAATGDATKAREVRRALVSRFPDSALAATAAQQLAATAVAASPSSVASSTPAGNGYAAGVVGGAGLPLAECRRMEDASDIPRKMAALQQDNLNQMTRGIIVAADFMIDTYRACLPDPTAQQIVAQYEKTRAETLVTCRKVSSTDNCTDSPFR